jgi:hypothetical protein
LAPLRAIARIALFSPNEAKMCTEVYLNAAAGFPALAAWQGGTAMILKRL